MDMRSFLVRKSVYVVITLFAIIAFNFFLFRVMPGDPVKILIPKGLTPELEAYVRHEFGLDKPLWEQFIMYMGQVLTFDLGVTTTIKGGEDCWTVIQPRLVNTLILVGLGTMLSIWLGVTLGKHAAWRKGKPIDTIGMAAALVFYSMPTFLFALALLMVFAGTYRLFPLDSAYGRLPDWAESFLGQEPLRARDMTFVQMIFSRAYHLVLPLIAFTLEIMAEFALIMRNSMTDVLSEDYITTARAKGVPAKTILNGHAMRNALLPVVTVMAISVGWVLGGTIMVEMVFSYDGLGKLTWDAVMAKDFALLQAIFLLMAIAVLLANLAADIVYTYLDPRVKI